MPLIGPSDPARVVQMIEEVASPGLTDAVHNSLAYRLAELESHFHNWESILGLAVTPSAETHRADRVGTGVHGFILLSGNDNWGAWVQILGSNDTPSRTGTAYFDLNQIIVEAVSTNGTYFIQIAFGATAAGALAAGNYTETIIARDSVVSSVVPMEIRARRFPAGTKVWARVLCHNDNAESATIYLGMHEYEG